MHVRRLAASGILLATCGLVTGAASPALAVCDAYSATCPTEVPTPPSDTRGNGETDLDETDLDEDKSTDISGGGGGATNGSGGGGGGGDATNGGGGGGGTDDRTLPFTGGELVLLTSIGGAALVGGTALVLAGRRKSQPAT